MATAFNPETLNRNFEILSRFTRDTPYEAFNNGLTEVSKLIKLLGSALGIAAKDLEEKVSILEAHFARIKEATPADGIAEPVPDAAGDGESKVGEGAATAAAGAGAGGGIVRLTLQYLIELEISEKKEAMNNKSKYVSGARSVLRMMWFLDFVHELIKNLEADEATELRGCASKAYDVALAPHHPWLLRKTAAMLALPYRAAFLERVSTGTAADGLAILSQFNTYVIPLREALWAYYRERGIHELP